MTSLFHEPPDGERVAWDEKVEEEEVAAFLKLKGIPRLGDRGIWELIRRHGSGVAALRSLGSQPELWGPTPSPVESLERKTHDFGPCPLTSPHYPSALLALTDPPPLLFMQGRRDLLFRPGVAVVGARKATEAGRRTAEALGRALGRGGITVISGMALGIDGAAHRGALEVGGDTIAVLGSGLDVVYPPAHRGLYRKIGEVGLALSEFSPGTPALPHHFPKRNRILAALARVVVVVEAGERSGALITVDHALDLGKDILAVPGSVESPQSAGTNALIRDGARILTHPEAILDELPWAAGPSPTTTTDGEDRIPPEISADLVPLWQALITEPRRLDQLAGEARMAPETVLAGLCTLELLGLAFRCPGMRFRR